MPIDIQSRNWFFFKSPTFRVVNISGVTVNFADAYSFKQISVDEASYVHGSRALRLSWDALSACYVLFQFSNLGNDISIQALLKDLLPKLHPFSDCFSYIACNKKLNGTEDSSYKILIYFEDNALIENPKLFLCFGVVPKVKAYPNLSYAVNDLFANRNLEDIAGFIKSNDVVTTMSKELGLETNRYVSVAITECSKKGKEVKPKKTLGIASVSVHYDYIDSSPVNYQSKDKHIIKRGKSLNIVKKGKALRLNSQSLFCCHFGLHYVNLPRGLTLPDLLKELLPKLSSDSSNLRYVAYKQKSVNSEEFSFRVIFCFDDRFQIKDPSLFFCFNSLPQIKGYSCFSYATGDLFGNLDLDIASLIREGIIVTNIEKNIE
jgi:hypothetical protein